MKVIADYIDDKVIRFKCPLCWTKYKKNGQPYKSAKNRIHTHGSCGELHNRTEHRVHHGFNPLGKSYEDVEILITDETERGTRKEKRNRK